MVRPLPEFLHQRVAHVERGDAFGGSRELHWREALFVEPIEHDLWYRCCSVRNGRLHGRVLDQVRVVSSLSCRWMVGSMELARLSRQLLMIVSLLSGDEGRFDV